MFHYTSLDLKGQYKALRAEAVNRLFAVTIQVLDVLEKLPSSQPTPRAFIPSPDVYLGFSVLVGQTLVEIWRDPKQQGAAKASLVDGPEPLEAIFTRLLEVQDGLDRLRADLASGKLSIPLPSHV
jgi:hypothetical protein